MLCLNVSRDWQCKLLSAKTHYCFVPWFLFAFDILHQRRLWTVYLRPLLELQVPLLMAVKESRDAFFAKLRDVFLFDASAKQYVLLHQRMTCGDGFPSLDQFFANRDILQLLVFKWCWKSYSAWWGYYLCSSPLSLSVHQYRQWTLCSLLVPPTTRYSRAIPIFTSYPYSTFLESYYASRRGSIAAAFT